MQMNDNRFGEGEPLRFEYFKILFLNKRNCSKMEGHCHSPKIMTRHTARFNDCLYIWRDFFFFKII